MARVELSFADGAQPVELPLIPDDDVDNYDPCLLPDGDVIFASSAPFTGVPCVAGHDHVVNLYRWHRADGRIRHLTFEQDHDRCPTVLPDGRVLYLRWEYTDLPHFVSRILFTMNPDGTAQRAFYGSNSYWPNALFYARPVPGDPARFLPWSAGITTIPEWVNWSCSIRGADASRRRAPCSGSPAEAVRSCRCCATG